MEVWMKLDYLNHEFVSGNKLRKLKYNVEALNNVEYDNIVSFGGPHSNHLFALAYLGEQLQINTIGLVRGDYHLYKSPTLTYCEERGMHIHYLSKEQYSQKTDPSYLANLHKRFPKSSILAEGGRTELSLKGCSEIVAEVEGQLGFKPTHYINAIGTGTTICGIADGLGEGQLAIGVSVLKSNLSGFQLEPPLDAERERLTIHNDYHFGGYAKFDDRLIRFVQQFSTEYQIPIDPIYNAKSVFATFDLIAKAYFPTGSRIVLIHTGGLQGTFAFCEQHKLSPSIFGM